MSVEPNFLISQFVFFKYVRKAYLLPGFLFQALLLAAGEGASPLLTWNARLCLLHAYLARGSSGGEGGKRRRTWLPSVADSACSSALQAIATAGANTRNTGSGTTSGSKERAQPPTTRATPTNGADEGEPSGRSASGGGGRAGTFSATAVAQVCTELAGAAAGAGPSSSAQGSFLHGYLRSDSHGALLASSLACTTGMLPGEQMAGALRLKLRALRDALLAGGESERTAAEKIGPRVAPALDVVAEEVDVSPHAVQRALERSRVGDAFVLAVQVIVFSS